VPIREPLTKSLPEEFAKEATKIFTMIMKYMGDYPSKKGLDSFKLMQKVRQPPQQPSCLLAACRASHLRDLTALQICQRGIDNPKLRDELYCQLIKQVSKNPKRFVQTALSPAIISSAWRCLAHHGAFRVAQR
jgi:hypothetical protein